MKNLISAAALSLLTSSAMAFTVSVPLDTPAILFPIGYIAGSFSGHEEITRQALNRVDSNLKAQGIDSQSFAPDFLGNLKAGRLGVNGLSTGNKIIQGNYATDLPHQLTGEYDIPRFHNQPSAGWTNNPQVQVLHFLQNKNSDGSLVSQYETCELAKTEIVRATTEGLNLWYAGDIKSALFLFGHATHTIQDSFSQAHTARASAENNFDLMKVCYYGDFIENASSCYHLRFDTNDDVWRENPVTYLGRVVTRFLKQEKALEANLKPEAVLARTSTMRYLYLVATYLYEHKSEFYQAEEVERILTEKLFEGITGNVGVDQGLYQTDVNQTIPMPNGIIRCGNLDKN